MTQVTQVTQVTHARALAQLPQPLPRRLPLTVVGGFLGAGKTSLLNHWLRNCRGQRMAVLVNDFGALNIDAGLIAATHGDTVALTNGCVCCQIGDELTQALLQLTAAARAFDAVLIEASGVSDPWRIAQIAMAAPQFSLEGVVVLVDASAAAQQARDPLLADTLERQLKSADLVLLNKTDLASAAALGAARAWVAASACGTACIETRQAALPPAPPWGPAQAGAAHGGHDQHASPEHGALFQSWSAQPQAVIPAAALRAWLRAAPPGLLRLKGLLRTGPGLGGEAEWSELQFAGRHSSLRRAPAPAANAHSGVVAIGLRGQLPEAALREFFTR